MNVNKELLLRIQGAVQTFRYLENCHMKKETDTTSNHYDFLYLLAQEMKPKKILELGTHWGASAWYLHKGCESADIYTIDNNLIKSPNLAKYIIGLPKVKFILGDCKSKEVVDQIPNDIDLMFIDEEKDVEALEQNLALYYPKLRTGGVMLFDDLLGANYYPEANRWWNDLKGYNKLDLPLVHQGYALGAIIK